MNIYEITYPSGHATDENDAEATAVVIARDANAAKTLLGKGRAVKRCRVIGTTATAQSKATNTPRIVSAEE